MTHTTSALDCASFSSPMASSSSTPDSSPPPLSATMDESTAVSESMRREEAKMLQAREQDDADNEKRMDEERRKDLAAGSEALDKKHKALDFLLQQSKLYANIMLQQMQEQEQEDATKDQRSRNRAAKREEVAEQVATDSQRRTTRVSASANLTLQPKQTRGRPKKSDTSQTKLSKFFTKSDVQAKAGSGTVAGALKEAIEDNVKAGDVGIQNLKSARQPSILTGGTMRKYQLEGLEWLKSLYENGLNGILADEMGLGKTIQTISFLAFLREMETYGPFLIAAPLSTTTNWVDEFNKWTPSIPVVLYHGSIDERARIRRTKLKSPGSSEFPVVVTSYEICMNDRKYLSSFGWKFIIIDEGHRIKNLNCKLVRELQSLQSANRLLITGTPLQNNLSELWSLLHFLMPDIFDKLESFESWFDFSALKDKDGYDQIFSKERQNGLIASLHSILKPFLLRRVKADVEKLLPKKREYVLFAPLTPLQRELYQSILDGTSRAFLEDKVVERVLGSGTGTPNSIRSLSVGLKRKSFDSGANTPNKSARTSRHSTPASSVRSGRRGKRRDYSELSDRKYFASLEQSPTLETDSSDGELDSKTLATTLDFAKKQIANKKLQNPIMQLRLACNSPYNFYNPYLQPDGTEDDPDESLVQSSGKMLILDTLLPRLFAENHKVLIFSQFKTQLDILQSYATLRGWDACRIDGSVPQSERAAQIRAFNEPTGATNLFLLSTRAGGQGINLAAADTVVLFDSDWNPQQDLQAQDRAHRIGQTRNVLVYRLATRGTVEQALLDAAQGKRRLEKLVIRKGGLRASGGLAAGSSERERREQRDDLEELRRLLRRADGEAFDVQDGAVLGERDLAILTDRGEEAYARAERGDDEGEAFRNVGALDGGLLESLKV